MRHTKALLALVGALAFPTVADGGTFEWSGTVGPGFGNGQCIWYSGQSACSGWAYWYQLNAANSVGDIVLAGFQNNSTVRGYYLAEHQSVITYPSNHNLGGYLKSHVTWCSWRIDCALQGGANVWLKSWA